MESSIQPRKQRKARYEAPLHLRRKMMHVHLSRLLRTKLGIKKRSLLVRKGDKVRLRKGSKAGHVGVVMDADYSSLKIYVEGVAHRNARGVEKLAPISPSNVEIMDGDFTLKDRAAKIAARKQG